MRSRNGRSAIEADSARAFGSLAEKVADYEALLKDLCTRVEEEDANLIKSLLEKVLNTSILFLAISSDPPPGCCLRPRRLAGSC